MPTHRSKMLNMHIGTKTRTPGSKIVEPFPGIAIQSPVWVIATDVNGYDVELMVVPIEGRLAAQEVKVSQSEGGAPVTSASIRSIPVGQLVKHAARHAQIAEERDGGRVYTTPTMTEHMREGSRQGNPDAAMLRLVAHAYRLALLVGEPPTKSVEETFELSRSKAGRWIALAREGGFLGAAAKPGKASA